MKFDDRGKMPDGLIGIVVVEIEPSQPKHGFRGFGAARRIFQCGFINLDGPVIFFDERQPGKIIVAVSAEKEIRNFELALDDLVIIDPRDVAEREFLETIEFRSVFASFPVGAGRADERIDFLNRIIRLNIGFQIRICGREEYPLVFQFPSGGKGLQCAFFIRRKREKQDGAKAQT